MVKSISCREVSKEQVHWNLPFRSWPQVMVMRHSIITACSTTSAVQPSAPEFLKMRRPKWTDSNSLSFNSSTSNQPWEVQEGSRKEPRTGQLSLQAGTLRFPHSLRALAHNHLLLDQRRLFLAMPRCPWLNRWQRIYTEQVWSWLNNLSILN